MNADGADVASLTGVLEAGLVRIASAGLVI